MATLVTSSDSRPSATNVPLRAVQALLLCGIVASALYVANDLICAMRYPGYSMRDQAISELSAVGAPTAPLWAQMGAGYGMLMLAFSIGVLRVPNAAPALRLTGWILFLFPFLGILWAFVPMHQHGAATSWQDAGHIAAGGLSLLVIAGFMSAGAFVFGRRFRVYSFTSVGVLIATGFATFMFVSSIGANAPTPWLGLIERLTIYDYLLWVAVFSSLLLSGWPRVGVPRTRMRPKSDSEARRQGVV